MMLLKRSQFHGARRLGDPNHRLYWLVAQLLLLACAILVVWVTITRYLSNPTYITHSTAVQTWASFPAVILCPEIQFPLKKIDRFVTEVSYPSEINSSYIRGVLDQLAAFFSPDVTFDTSDLEAVQQLLDYNKLDIETAGINVTSSCEEILIKCRWKGKFINCSSLFQMELTKYGFCCVFNGRSLRREIKEFRRTEREVERVHRNNVGPGKGLMVAIGDNYAAASVDLSYKWFSLANGYSYVDMTSNGSPVSPGIEIWTGYTAGTIQLSDAVKQLSDDIRRCRLSTERLTLFPEYRRDYCLLECEIHLVISKCKCTQITHPLVLGVPRCKAHQLSCARQAVVSFGVDDCNCPTNCEVDKPRINHFSYHLEPNAATFDPFYDQLNLSGVSIIRVFVKNYNRMITQRKSIFTSFNLFAQLGGVFNVFFGVSVLSLLELIMLAWRTLQDWTSGKYNNAKMIT